MIIFEMQLLVFRGNVSENIRNGHIACRFHHHFGLEICLSMTIFRTGSSTNISLEHIIDGIFTEMIG